MPANGLQKRIFLLTDGMVNDPDEVINLARICNDSIRTHTFGIGDGCDLRMVKETAHAGRGSYSIVSNKNANELNGLVINALKRAIEPSLKECQVWLGNDNSILHEVYRN